MALLRTGSIICFMICFAFTHTPANSFNKQQAIKVSTLSIFGATLNEQGNPLPEFVDTTIKAKTIDAIDVTCPDDIWNNLDH